MKKILIKTIKENNQPQFRVYNPETTSDEEKIIIYHYESTIAKKYNLNIDNLARYSSILKNDNEDALFYIDLSEPVLEDLLRQVGFRKCDDCGAFIPPDLLASKTVYLGNNVRLCNACKEKRDQEEIKHKKIKVYGYHSGPGFDFIQDEDETMAVENFKGYGVEIEFDKRSGRMYNRDHYIISTQDFYDFNRDGRKQNKYFKFEHDGSLYNGVEAISHCMSGKFIKKFDWVPLCNLGRYLGADDSISTTGLHVHISKTILGDNEKEQVSNALKLYYIMNAYELDFLKMSNRCKENMSYCEFLTHAEIVAIAKRLSEKESYFFNCFPSYHNKAIINSDKTIEIRIFKSTTDPERLKHLINFVVGLTENIKNVKWGKIYCMSKIFKTIDPLTMQYWRKNGCFNKTIADVKKGDLEALEIIKKLLDN